MASRPDAVQNNTSCEDEIGRLKSELASVEAEKQSTWEMVNRMLALNLAEGHFNQVINSVSQVAASSLDFHSTLQVVADQLGEAMQADGCYVTLWDEETHTTLPGAAYGPFRDTYPQMRPKPGEVTVTGSLLDAQRTLLIPDVFHSPYISPELAARFPAKSLIGLPMKVNERLIGGVLIAYNDAHYFDPEEVARVENLVGPLALIISKALLYEEVVKYNKDLKAAYEETLEGWSRAVDLRDNEVEGHTRRVTALTVQLAQRMGIHGQELDFVRWGAILHDVGKLGVPDYILRKPGAYSPEEYELMKQHAHYGKQFLENIAFLRPAVAIPFSHHEKWDGSGYPQGLAGEEIPFGARLFAVIDVWDALTQDRYYKKAWPPAEALAYIREQSGKQFDPQVVKAFCQMMDDEEHKAA